MECTKVSAAAGGVGTFVVQLLKIRGAKIVGIASESNKAWLEGHGVIHIAYGEGLVNRIRSATNGKIDAFIDLYGPGLYIMFLCPYASSLIISFCEKNIST